MRIDWDKVRISIVPADKDHPNAGNPYARLSPKEREDMIVSTSARIWSRHIRESLSRKNP